MVLLWCADIFNVAVEVWLAYWLFDVPKHRRFHQPWVRVLEYLGFLGIPGGFIIYDRMLGMRFSNVQIIFLVIIFFISAIIFTTRDIFCCIAWAGIYYGTISLLELPGIVLSGWITGQPYLACIYQPIVYDYIYLVILSIGLIIIANYIGQFIRKHIGSTITKKNFGLWLVFSISEWWVITYFLIIGDQKTGRDVFFYNIVSVICMLFLILGFASFMIYRQAESLKQQHQLQEVCLESEYMKIKNEYQRKAKEIHDIKHHLQAIRAYLLLGSIDKSKDYLENLIGDLVLSQNQIHTWTGNPLVDSLLSGKKMSANKLGIRLDINATQISSRLSDKDMSVLLGNLIDNAIEAASKVVEDRKIVIQILGKANMLFIHVKNSMTQSPVIKDGKFLSSKSDKSNHGWGMKSIEAIVEKYGGQMDFSYDNKVFEINITFWEKVR